MNKHSSHMFICHFTVTSCNRLFSWCWLVATLHFTRKKQFWGSSFGFTQKLRRHKRPANDRSLAAANDKHSELFLQFPVGGIHQQSKYAGLLIWLCEICATFLQCSAQSNQHGFHSEDNQLAFLMLSKCLSNLAFFLSFKVRAGY